MFPFLPKLFIAASFLILRHAFTFLVPPPHAPLLCLSSDCQFDISGWDGVIRSRQVEEEERVKPGDALDCIWTIRAPPQSKVGNIPPQNG